jgi:23S rRNA (adenine2503-C2)-methyltransferase
MNNPDISRPAFAADLDPAGAEALMAKLGEPRYRSAQLLGWVYKKRAASFADMTDFPLALRDKLSQELSLSSVSEVERREAADGSIKALLGLYDGETIEAALLPSTRGFTACLSSQVGCAVACPFCATGSQGFTRNLAAAEMIDQALYFSRRLEGEQRLGNIVFMGMGEPLANYEGVMEAVGRLNAPWGPGMAARSITISTAGLVPGIDKLAGEKLQVGLAVSLHAASDELRDRLVPLNRKYPLGQLMAACRNYITRSGRRISFEYCLFNGLNDSLARRGSWRT